MTAAGYAPARTYRSGRVLDDELFDHLVRDHGRVPHELDVESLVAIHELEHFDAVVGLLRLDHAHAGRARQSASVAAQPASVAHPVA